MDRQALSLPIDAPESLLNSLTVGLFNRLYYGMQNIRRALPSNTMHPSFILSMPSAIGTGSTVRGAYGNISAWCPSLR